MGLKKAIKEVTNKENSKKEVVSKEALKVTPSKSLKEQADKNTTVVQKKAKEPEKVVKQGTNKDHAPKHNMDQGQPDHNPQTVGISFGITKNMGDYESLRVDCWLTDTVQEGETHQEELVRLGDIAQAQVEYEVSRIQ